jgi:hypothetical protein
MLLVISICKLPHHFKVVSQGRASFCRYCKICRGADKSLAFPIFSTTKRIFLGWVKEVRTIVCGAQGGICRVNTFFQSCSSLFSL